MRSWNATTKTEEQKKRGFLGEEGGFEADDEDDEDE